MLHAATCPAQLCQVRTHCLIKIAPAVDELSKICWSHGTAKADVLSIPGASALEIRWLRSCQAVAALIGGILRQPKRSCSREDAKLLIVCSPHSGSPRFCSSQSYCSSPNRQMMHIQGTQSCAIASGLKWFPPALNTS